MQAVIFAVNSFWLVVLAFLAASILVIASGFCNVEASAPEIAPIPHYASSATPKTAPATDYAYAPMQITAQPPEMPVLDWLNAPAPGISASEALGPSFFIYGDSTVDSGNNNYLRTLARANIPPYGRDFDTHRPTGRFSNGRLSIDYLASFMGLPFAPPYLSEPNFTMKLYGVNFASAGAGVFTASGNDLGQHIPLADQVREAFEFKKELSLTYGGQTASSFMGNSIHYISVGSNDFIHNYLRNVSGIEVEERPIQFNERLVAELASQIEVLYDVGIRKVVTVGIGPLGCAPYFLYQNNSSDGACISDINYLIEEYNALLGLKVEELSLKYHDLNIIFCNIYDSLKQIVQDPHAYGFESANMACCGAGRYGGWLMCIFPGLACCDASSHVWWDEFHLTDKANMLLAEAIWAGDGAGICQPVNLRDLASIPISTFSSCNSPLAAPLTSISMSPLCLMDDDYCFIA